MINLDDLPMRVAIGQFSELTDEQLAFAKQVGADDVLLNTPRLPGDERWEYEDLLAWRRRAEEHGLRLITLENVPVRFYDNIMLGQDGRERQAVETHPSPMHGLDFCHGCWSEMRGGAGVLDAIRYFGGQRRLFYIHLRDVVGKAEEKFTEVFLGDGNCNPVQTVKALKEAGF